MFRCPNHSIHKDQGLWLRIRHTVTCVSIVTEEEEVDDYDVDDLCWRRHDVAFCDCGWQGTVDDITVDEEEPEEEEA